MIVEIDQESSRIKSITIGDYRPLFKGEIYVPDNWGTKEILSNFCIGEYGGDSFAIKKDIDREFSLFDIDNDYEDQNIRLVKI